MGEIRVRGIRGAISVEENSAEAIRRATIELIETIKAKNNFSLDDVASVIFTTTPDLTELFPASVARELGWQYVPLLGAGEIEAPGSLRRIIRVLIHINTTLSQREINHVYLGEAKSLRQDLV